MAHFLDIIYRNRGSGRSSRNARRAKWKSLRNVQVFQHWQQTLMTEQLCQWHKNAEIAGK